MSEVSMKKASKSKTVWTFGSALVASLTALVLHYTGVAPLGAEMLHVVWTATASGVIGIMLRFATGEPLERRSRRRGSTRIETLLLTFLLALLLGLTLWASTSCDTRFGRSLPRAGACAAACAVECSQSQDKTACAVRCALACAAEWVGGLLTRESATALLAEPEGLPKAGDELVVPVRDDAGQTVLLRAHLSGSPIHVGSGAFVVRLHDGRGPSWLLPLCPEPRPYCASPAGSGDVPVVSVPPPRSLEEFGELPSFTP